MEDQVTYVSVDVSTCLSVGVRGIHGNVDNLKQLAVAAVIVKTG